MSMSASSVAGVLQMRQRSTWSGFTNMAAIHRVAPVDQAGGHDQLIDAGLARVVFKRGRESLWKLATSLRLIVLATS